MPIPRPCASLRPREGRAASHSPASRLALVCPSAQAVAALRACASGPEVAAVAMAAACARLVPRSATAGVVGLTALPSREDRPCPLYPFRPAPSACPWPVPVPQRAPACCGVEGGAPGLLCRGGICWGQFNLQARGFKNYFIFTGCFSSSGYRISSDGKPEKFQPPPKPVIIDKQKQREERR